MPIETPPRVALREAELLQAIEELHGRREPGLAVATRTRAPTSAFFFMSRFLKPSSFGMIALNSTRPTVVFSQRAPSTSSTQNVIGVWQRHAVLRQLHLDFGDVRCSDAAVLTSSVSKSGRRLGREVAAEHDVLADGSATGRPSDGLRMLFDDSMSSRASSCASNDSGTCTAIWSPSKSALNAAQTSG